ncbi:unnamed protein product [Prorocentrum cordatum]|uniref:Prolyl 4-hydroxylase alpha subunit Fe(2+) 2OG dioxygenase domain-containing protein n=1 Tax=Prorocentrum cordatum TaxID=2364126 RepID=A0ABN9SK27_9DINO|nr:unnamed protein product [Polarella glacialis]
MWASRCSPGSGSVLLWYNYHANGRGDYNALHGGCPPAEGLEKWTGNKWIRIKPGSTPPAEWMEDHPGLKRFGWKENALEDLVGRRKVQDDPAATCSLSVSNLYSKTDALKLAWINPKTRQAKEVAEVLPGRSTQLKSFLVTSPWPTAAGSPSPSLARGQEQFPRRRRPRGPAGCRQRSRPAWVLSGPSQCGVIPCG